jgi:NADH-quinone oxidoreductase subunit E
VKEFTPQSVLQVITTHRDKIGGIMSQATTFRAPEKRAEVITELYTAVQQHGYLSEAALKQVSERLDIPLADVYSTATFYTHYRTQPTGRYIIQVCEGLTCSLMGGAEVLSDYLCQKLGIELGETTPDGKFTLETVQCLAACDSAPAMRVNDELYEHLTQEEVDAIINMLAGG